MEHDNLHEAPETVEIHDDKSHEGKLSVLLGILKKWLPLIVVCPRADCPQVYWSQGYFCGETVLACAASGAGWES